jgi:hypothetical protein
MKILCSLLYAFLAASLANAQAIKLNTVRAKPQLTLGSISLSASPATVTFNLVSGGTASASSAINITSSGSSLGLFSTMSLYAYFASSNALVSPAGDAIPASAIYAKCTTGLLSAFTAFTQTTPLSGASGLLVVQDTSLLDLLIGGGRTDALSLQINLTGQPQLPAGTYSGTLVLQAQAF